MSRINVSSLPSGVRRATASDLEVLLPLYSEFHADLARWVQDPADWREAVLALNNRPYVAVQLAQAAGEAVGFAVVRGRPTAPDTVAVLEDLYVRPSARRFGWGRRLAIEALADFAAGGGRELWVETGSSNRAARSLYESLGFHCPAAPGECRERVVYRRDCGPADAAGRTTDNRRAHS